MFLWGARNLKRYGRKQKISRRASTLFAMLLILPLSVIAAFSAPMDIGALTERAALLSAMVNMPEGSLALLESRFAQEIDESYYNSEETEVEPYMAPWPEPSAPQQKPSSGTASQNEPSARPAPQTDGRPPVTAPSPAKDKAPAIPKEHRGTLLQENMAGASNGLLSYGVGKLRNYTEVSDEEVTSIMQKGMELKLEDIPEPQVLIFHTHATESYESYDSEIYDTRNTWRSTDNNINMVAVGNVLAKQLEDAGIGVIHDTTKHDFPSYNGSYERSAETIKRYLEKYPSIKVVLDVHRDAIQREDDLIVKPVVEINGKKAAQLMIITGSDDGTMNIPHWEKNLQFAAAVQDAIEQDYPHLTRPIFFCYRKYNMDLTTGSLLLEVGACGNTLEESLYTAEMVGKSLAKLLNESKSK